MEIAYAILATAAELSGDGRVHLLNGGINRIVGPFPGLLPRPLTLVACIDFAPGECGREYDIVVDIIGPDGKEVVSGKEKSGLLPPAEEGKTSRSTFFFTFLGTPFETVGKHAIRIAVEGQVLKQLDLHIERDPELGVIS
jgi:Family of unknown function (DUF6941)